MIRYEEKKLMKDVTPAALSKAEAKKLTQKIKSAVDELWSLLVKAHEGKAWKALGYQTWEAYVKAEFGMSRSRAYQLLDQGQVIEAVRTATGDLSNALDISARDVDAVKADLPAVTDEIRSRVEGGEEPTKAVAEVVEAKRAEKAAKKAARDEHQAEHDRQREEHAAKLPDHVKAHEAARDTARQAKKDDAADDGLTEADRTAELEEAVRALEAENAELKARISEDEELGRMRREWREGGWDKVIEKLNADHAEVVRVQDRRIESESADKASWKRSADYWKKWALDHGYDDENLIRVASAEPTHG